MDGQDETLVTYDKEIIDDELNEIWPSFKANVRIVMISDTCNSGTNYKLAGAFNKPTPFIPMDKAAEDAMKAQMIHFGACRDGLNADGYQSGGAFTLALCKVWRDGEFHSYRELLNQAASIIGEAQNPQYNEYGPVTDAFSGSKPFQV